MAGCHPLADAEDPRGAHVFNPQDANGEDAVAAESGSDTGAVKPKAPKKSVDDSVDESTPPAGDLVQPGGGETLVLLAKLHDLERLLGAVDLNPAQV